MNTSGLELPEGWPDVRTLERLANEFFSAVPGTPPIVSAPPLPGFGASPGLSSIPHDLGGIGAVKLSAGIADPNSG